MPYLIYEFQLNDFRTQKVIGQSGGALLVTAAGSPDTVQLFDPVTFAQANQPVALTRGKVKFAVADTVNGVDMYGFAPGGQFVEFLGVRANELADGFVDLQNREQVAKVPFSIANATANVEKDTGLDFPVGALVSPFVAARITTLEAARTISFGILSSESGGSATGIINAISTAAAGTVSAKSAATATRGSLIGAGTLDIEYAVATGSQSISYTLAASTTLAKGFALLPYRLTA